MMQNNNKIYNTVSEQITEKLRRELLLGKMISGQKLNEQKLAERFAVSRRIIRTSLQTLTQEGFLISQPRKGVIVNGDSSKEIRPLLMYLRREIEVFALTHIFDRLEKEDLETWEKILENIRKNCYEGNLEIVIQYDMEFHRFIIDKYDDQDIFNIWKYIVVRKRMKYSRYHNLNESYEEHQRIFQAIRSAKKRGH